MPRAKVPRQGNCPYHVTGRTNNREPFPVPLGEVWKVFLQQLSKVEREFGIEVIAFVLMGNHYHLLVRPPQSNLPEAMGYLLREVSRTLGRKSGRINHIFGGRYKACLIDEPTYLANVYRYVYRNPVAASLCERVEDYPYSTLPALLGRATLPFEVHEQAWAGDLPRGWANRLTWLNTPFHPKQTELLRRALSHSTFRFPKRNAYAPWVESLGRSKRYHVPSEREIRRYPVPFDTDSEE